MLNKTTCPDTIGKSRLSARLVSDESERAAKAGFAGKNLSLIFIAAIFTGLLATGCGLTTYVSLKESYREQVEHRIADYEKDEDVGAEVILSLQNGKEINGELLSVRDSAVTICTEHSATEEELASLKYPINTVRDDEIQEITVEGSNYVWAGFGIGLAAGVGMGLIVVAITSTYGGLFGGGLIVIAASIVGPIVGYSLSTEEFVLQEIPPGYDLSILKPLARYPDEEPEYLRAIE